MISATGGTLRMFRSTSDHTALLNLDHAAESQRTVTLSTELAELVFPTHGARASTWKLSTPCETTSKSLTQTRNMGPVRSGHFGQP